MENPRTTSARDHDDHELIDAAVADHTPPHSNISGHGIGTDVSTQADMATITDPDGVVRPQKEDDIHNGQRRAAGKPRDMTG